MQLSKNFHLSELTVSQTAARHGLNNKPNVQAQKNLDRLCDTVLQPLRDALGQPIIVTSGYRSPEVNRRVGGSATSAHCYGCAADIHVPGMSSIELMKKIHSLKLPVDQVIEEFGQWVHVGIAIPGNKPRYQYLNARYVGGQAVYSPAKVG